jgi:hypothetical protein
MLKTLMSRHRFLASSSGCLQYQGLIVADEIKRDKSAAA